MSAMPALRVSMLLAVTSFLLQLSSVQGQQDFTRAQVPDPFRVGNFYPPRPEVDVCRPIRDYIDRNSVRFTNELVTNTNPNIIFSTADSRIMSSRMQSNLNTLATLYRLETSRRMTVLRAWTQFPSSQINNRMSLHYEGRSVQIRLPSGSNYNQFLQLAVEAAFDWVAYNRSNLITLSVIPTNCDRSVDCVFVLDQSGSVGRRNHNIAIQFIENIVAFFNIGINQTRVGFVAYESRAYREFDLNDYTTLSSLTTRIGNVNYRGGGTRTGRALNEARTLLNPANSHGARPDSDGIPKIVVLITDGRSHDNVVSPSNLLKQVGVIVYAVGIGGFNVNELRTISSDPDNEHVFLLSSYRDAAGFVDFLSVTTCETPAIINPDGNVTTTIPPGGLEYFQTQCSAYTDTVLVELTDLNGTNFLYVSATEDNPGPLTENTLRNETTGIGRRTLTLTLPSSSNTVYIGVQGQAQQNAFNIIVWDQLFRISDVRVNILVGGSGQRLIYDVGQNLLGRAPTTSLRYSIIEGNTNGLFVIDTRGRVYVSNQAQLNPNRQEFHNLTVLARHENINCQRARTRITIRLFSNRITFGTVNTVTISENEAIGRQVARITATGGRGPIQFSITSGNLNNKFTIGSSTGVITLANALNYETRQTYTLTVRAQTTEERTVTGTVHQRVDVMDVNEAPSFVTPCAMAGSCTFRVSERQSANDFVGRVEAQDPDLNSVPNGRLSYRLSPVSTPFSVNTSGHISTTQPLDREMRDTYTLTLSVSDSSVTIQTTVIFIVNDIDDNSPVFIQAPGSIQVRENIARGIEVAQYIAQDNDIGTNAAIVYAFTPANSQVPFSIHSQTGVLSVNGDIDYETAQAYTIRVTARNPNNMSSNVSHTTIISITNINDNTPRFGENPYTENVTENTSRGTTVATVSATDADLGSFGLVTYSIVGGNFLYSFAIDGQSGVITNQVAIDREEVSSFSLRIEARDMGNRRRTARVEISIIDVNDNTPVFVNTPYQVQVREDVAVPFDVLQVTATDADEPGNPNSQVTYNITSGNFGDAFTIDSSTGQIYATTALDFEVTPFYTLNIQAFDEGTPSRSAETTVTITVLNVNEDPPRISGDQAVNISESASVESIVASYTALDPDNNAVTFAIISGNAENRFSVEASNGRITLANPLNYEMTTMYSIVIEASDGQRSTSAKLNVTVLDENEFSPVFMGRTVFSANEEEPDGTLVGTVMATDADGDPSNNRITYSFVQQTSQFTIDRNSGEIRTVGRLNRENLTQIFVPPASQVRLDVTAHDSASPSRQTTKSITITLVDINDNNPAFAATQYNNSLFENLPAGQIVFQVSADDQDLGSNGEVQYSFILNQNTNDTNLFQMDNITGVLSTTGPLDCEKRTNYTFTITATDSGIPSRNSSIQGTLLILDENDNSPVFSMNTYIADVPENSQINSIILTVSATDRDKGSNGEVRYSVMNEGGIFISIEGQGDEFTIFAINSTSGTLSHRTSFNYERATQVNVTVIAEDLGVPRRTSNATVTINVINIDESPPTFTSCPRSTFVVEELSFNSVLTHCIAEDPDNVTTSNTQVAVTYQISSGNDNGVFTINRTTGAILNAGRLDRETRQSYSLTIEATDLAGQSTSTDINIGIRDINDNAPKFIQNTYTYDFRDVSIQSYVQEIMRVSSSDGDSFENGTIRYSISQIMKSNIRAVITITASDMGIPQLSTNTTLTVNFESSCLLQDYEVDQVSGWVNAYVLCRIAILQMSLNVSLRSSDNIFSCSVLHNSRMSYQWVHNGSLITLPTLFPEQSSLPANYTITNARFEHAGEYACKATTRAGSLQSTSSSVKIRVAPTITVAPKNALVKEGETATFKCVGSGIPNPTVKWYDGLGNLIAEGTLLMRENVQSTNRNVRFICIVSSDAGRDEDLATLTVYSQQDVVKLVVDSVSNPTPTSDGSCHFINQTQIEHIFGTATKRVTMVTGVQGNNICEETPCLPNPCKNGGVCSISDTQGGYACTCRNGYNGENCNRDQDECADDPCFDDGTCVNTEGGFQCLCSDTTTGHLCQYSTDCLDPDACTNGTVCVSTLSQSYICRAPPPKSISVVITGELTQRDIGALIDLVQREVENQLAASAAATSRRRKRQTSGGISVTTLATACEPRFVQPDPQQQQFVLIWLCPTNTTEPTPEDQVVLCNVLLESPLVLTCTPPGGREMIRTTPAPLGKSSVTINIVLMDNTGKPIDSLVSSKEIEASGAVEQLKQATGLQVASVSVLDGEPRPGDSQGGAGVSVGMVMGIVIGAVLIIALVTAVVIAVTIFVRRKRDEEERKQLERRKAIQMLEKETTGGSDGSASEKTFDEEHFTASVDKLISGQPTEESTYESLQPATKAEENHYDSLPPRKTGGL